MNVMYISCIRLTVILYCSSIGKLRYWHFLIAPTNRIGCNENSDAKLQLTQINNWNDGYMFHLNDANVWNRLTNTLNAITVKTVYQLAIRIAHEWKYYRLENWSNHGNGRVWMLSNFQNDSSITFKTIFIKLTIVSMLFSCHRFVYDNIMETFMYLPNVNCEQISTSVVHR